jgi:hypothetical protein
VLPSLIIILVQHEHAIKCAEVSRTSGIMQPTTSCASIKIISRGIGGSQEPSFAHGGDVQPQQTQSHVTSPLDNKGHDAGQSSKVPGACQDSHIGSSEGAQ